MVVPHSRRYRVEREDLGEARRSYQEGLSIFRQNADQWGSARSCANLGYLACEQHDYAAAYSWLAEALRICQALEHRHGMIDAIEGFCSARRAAGRRQTCSHTRRRRRSVAQDQQRAYTQAPSSTPRTRTGTGVETAGCSFRPALVERWCGPVPERLIQSALDKSRPHRASSTGSC